MVGAAQRRTAAAYGHINASADGSRPALEGPADRGFDALVAETRGIASAYSTRRPI